MDGKCSIVSDVPHNRAGKTGNQFEKLSAQINELQRMYADRNMKQFLARRYSKDGSIFAKSELMNNSDFIEMGKSAELHTKSTKQRCFLPNACNSEIEVISVIPNVNASGRSPQIHSGRNPTGNVRSKRPSRIVPSRPPIISVSKSQSSPVRLRTPVRDRSPGKSVYRSRTTPSRTTRSRTSPSRTAKSGVVNSRGELICGSPHLSVIRPPAARIDKSIICESSCIPDNHQSNARIDKSICASPDRSVSHSLSSQVDRSLFNHVARPDGTSVHRHVGTPACQSDGRPVHRSDKSHSHMSDDTPAHQYIDTPTHLLDAESAHQSDGTSSHQYIGTPTHQINGAPAHNNVGIPVHRSVGTPTHLPDGAPAHQPHGTPVHRLACTPVGLCSGESVSEPTQGLPDLLQDGFFTEVYRVTRGTVSHTGKEIVSLSKKQSSPESLTRRALRIERRRFDIIEYIHKF
eukprot:923278_1